MWHNVRVADRLPFRCLYKKGQGNFNISGTKVCLYKVIHHVKGNICYPAYDIENIMFISEFDKIYFCLLGPHHLTVRKSYSSRQFPKSKGKINGMNYDEPCIVIGKGR